MKTLRLALWLMVVAAGSFLAYQYLTGMPATKSAQSVKLGGEFNLVRQDGTAISDKDMLGKPHAIFFGFTTCPEVCPTTLFEITTWLKELGDDGDKIAFYFMTVDPRRDTPEVMSEYLSAFDPRIIGISGDVDAVEKTLRSYKVFFEQVKMDDGDYTMDHTASIYLMDATGKFVRSIAYGEDGAVAVAKLRKMLN